MCGIAGMLALNGGRPHPAVLRSMCDAIRHRGPDDDGYYTDEFAGLGQRRLSIIDLAGGHQPLSNEDGSVWITFNGEIYNFQDIRRSLVAAGHVFRTTSDTEVIVHAYEEYGTDCVNHLRGMFAFAIWDSKRSRLMLARDRVGKKPLVYTEIDGVFLFSSELQGLAQYPGFSRDVDVAAIDDYLTYGYIPAPRTGFRNVHKLPPAHVLTIDLQSSDRTPKLRRYWQLDYEPKRHVSVTAAAEELVDLLRESVRIRMIADVPLGALLSGGTDSSMMVAIMSEFSPSSVPTFSIGFDEADFNELPYARRVADHFGADHHEFVVRPQALDVLPKLVRHYGEPYADSSAIPTFALAQMTRGYVKVAISGDGGDEAFGGYERYLGSLLGERYAKLPAAIKQYIIKPFAAAIPDRLPSRNRLRQFKRFVSAADRPLSERYAGWLTFFREEDKQTLYHADALERTQFRNPWLSEVIKSFQDGKRHHLDALLAADIESYLPYDLLTKMDIASMANSLEVRSPLLDHKVMEFAATLPVDYKIRGTTLKFLLKEVAKKRLPRDTVIRRKMGFGVPVGRWLKGELKPLLYDVLLSSHSMQRGYFRQQRVAELIERHVSGTADYTFQLWSLLCLELWHLEFVDHAALVRV